MSKPVFRNEAERRAWVLETIGKRCLGWKDISRYLGVSEVTAWRYWKNDETFPQGVSVGRPGSHRRWTIAEIDAWLDAKRERQRESR